MVIFNVGGGTRQLVILRECEKSPLNQPKIREKNYVGS